jgi:hypothetical protein
MTANISSTRIWEAFIPVRYRSPKAVCYPITKGLSVQWWAADGSRFFAVKSMRRATAANLVAPPASVNGELAAYSMSLPGGISHSIGHEMPSPIGRYALALVDGQPVVKRKADAKIYSLNRKGLQAYSMAWSPGDTSLALSFIREDGRSWIEAIDPESGGWTTPVSPQHDVIRGIAWLSETELIYAKREPAPRTDANLWAIKINRLTGLPSEAPRRRTQWTDFKIGPLSVNADSSRLCFFNNQD